MSKERFPNNFADPTQSGRNGYVYTPHDTEPLPILSRQVRILTDGDLEFVFAGYSDEDEPTLADHKITIPVSAGMELNYVLRYITTGTTAEVLVVY